MEHPILGKMPAPDFERNTLRVLRGEKPERTTLCEIGICMSYYEYMAGHKRQDASLLGEMRLAAEALWNAGHDCVPVVACPFAFPVREQASGSTFSLNAGAQVVDWESFEAYPWPDIEHFDPSPLEKMRAYLPDGMTLLVQPPYGVLETVQQITGYDNLCIMIYEEPELLAEICRRVGAWVYGYFERVAGINTVGVLCDDDDWGFNTQTFLSPNDLRRYIFPWHRKIVTLAHAYGKPCALHSCGYYADILEDVLDMGFDGRHSYEDNIVPVEQAYEQLAGRIAVMGGIDMNFMATATAEEVYRRCTGMLERSAERGYYMLGTGNSLTAYVPVENYMALLRAARDFRA